MGRWVGGKVGERVVGWREGVLGPMFKGVLESG